MNKGDKVLSSCGRYRGELTGAKRPCRTESCGGSVHTVRWDDGRVTYPCGKGLQWVAAEKAYQIKA